MISSVDVDVVVEVVEAIKMLDALTLWEMPDSCVDSVTGVELLEDSLVVIVVVDSVDVVVEAVIAVVVVFDTLNMAETVLTASL